MRVGNTRFGVDASEAGRNFRLCLIRDAGFDPVDRGPLCMARYTKPFALVGGTWAMTEAMGQSWLSFQAVGKQGDD
jgi:predicted dinucleotide-binding enzyme